MKPQRALKAKTILRNKKTVTITLPDFKIYH